MSEHDIEVQFVLSDGASAEPFGSLPDAAQIRGWVEATLGERQQVVEMAVRVVEEQEIRELNRRYRQQDKSTNVLSFPATMMPVLPGMPIPLGDLVVSAAVVSREAKEQRKPLQAHFAHMLVHGTLHLLGHEHQDDAEAEKMENLERQVLAGLGYPDPYRETAGLPLQGDGHA